MAIRVTDHGIKFDSTSRVLGKYSSPQIACFLLGGMWGMVREDGSGIAFLRPISELNKAEKAELAQYQIAMWQHLRDED